MVQWFFMIVQDAATSFLTFFFEILSKLNCEETFYEKGDKIARGSEFLHTNDTQNAFKEASERGLEV